MKSGQQVVSFSRQTDKLNSAAQPLEMHVDGSLEFLRVVIVLEELIALGVGGANYRTLVNAPSTNRAQSRDAGLDRQESRSPLLIDRSISPHRHLFNSQEAMLFLAEGFGHLLPTEQPERRECLTWVVWQTANLPKLEKANLTGRPDQIFQMVEEYVVAISRLLGVLEDRLSRHRYLAGDEYTIADIAIWPWLVELSSPNRLFDLSDDTLFKNIRQWMARIQVRPAVRRGQEIFRFHNTRPPLLNSHTKRQ